MLTGMSAEERNQFLERTSATAIANQAILKCSLAGFPLNIENVTMFVGDFLDPTNEDLLELMKKINVAIDEVLEVQAHPFHAAHKQ